MDTSGISKSHKWLTWPIIAVAIVVLLIGLFLVFLYTQFMGLGGWEPDKTSAYAVRARSVDGKMHPGMTRQQVKAIFQADIAANPGDNTEDTSNAYWGRDVPTWPIESDLYITEPRPHFWNSFDTGWTVRVAFDKSGKLIDHRLQMDAVGGP
jgi:hypothetical protein